MNQDKLKQMYANGGLLKALLKDPAQRKMAAQMLGGKEYGQGGMMKYANGGPVGPPGKKVPTSQEYVQANMPYYRTEGLVSPEYSGDRYREFVMNQALPQMMENAGVGRFSGMEDQVRRIASGYEPEEGKPFTTMGLQKYIAENLPADPSGVPHYLTRPNSRGETMLGNMFQGMSDYSKGEGVIEEGLYMYDPTTGQRARVTEEMYQQMGSPTEFMSEGERMYLPPAEGSRMYDAYQAAYGNARLSPMRSNVRFR